MPDALAARTLDLGAELSAEVVDVEVALAAFDAQAGMRADLEQLARLLMRAQALRVRVDHILTMHRSLMSRSTTPELGGMVRERQNWVGGSDVNPCSADFVPPPSTFVDPLLDDLCAFVNREDLPAVVQAAVVQAGMVHAQFETIRPFADGNGRTGRALIHVVLRRRGSATAYMPPVSLALATNSRAYIGGLTAFRYEGGPDSDAARESMRRWLEVFLEATRRAVMDAARLAADLEALQTRWRTNVRPCRSSAAD